MAPLSDRTTLKLGVGSADLHFPRGSEGHVLRKAKKDIEQAERTEILHINI